MFLLSSRYPPHSCAVRLVSTVQLSVRNPYRPPRMGVQPPFSSGTLCFSIHQQTSTKRFQNCIYIRRRSVAQVIQASHVRCPNRQRVGTLIRTRLEPNRARRSCKIHKDEKRKRKKQPSHEARTNAPYAKRPSAKHTHTVAALHLNRSESIATNKIERTSLPNSQGSSCTQNKMWGSEEQEHRHKTLVSEPTPPHWLPGVQSWK